MLYKWPFFLRAEPYYNFCSASQQPAQQYESTLCLKKKSSAGAWKWKWEHKLAPENYFPLPEKYSETGFERLTMSN
jgi:hypothetical protein